MYNENHVYASFLLRVGDNFYSELDIANHLDTLKESVLDGLIDLHTTEGALSIVHHGEELLGVDFWDEINLFVSSLVGKLPVLLQGQVVEEFLPLQTFMFRLAPYGTNVRYELISRTSLRPLHISRSLPLVPLVRSLELVFWRMAKILATLGSPVAQRSLTRWNQLVEPSIANIVDLQAIKYIVEQPIEKVLRENSPRA